MYRVTAIGVGTRGDVQPLAELGRELKKRGIFFCLATFEDFRNLTHHYGVSYFPLDGTEERLSELLVSEYRSSSDFFRNYSKFYGEYPAIPFQMEKAILGSDLVIYGTCRLLARSICDKYRIPCVRVFFSPFDKTRLYSLYTEKDDSAWTAFTSSFSDFGMTILTRRLFNSWREKNGLPRWKLTDDDRKQFGQWIPTFYPVSRLMMPRDPKWGDHIYVTGYWFHPEEETFENKELDAFLSQSPDFIFVTLGNDRSVEKDEMRERLIPVLHRLHIRAVMQVPSGAGISLGDDGHGIFLIDRIPFSWIMKKARAVVDHGGCTTVGLVLYYGIPQLVIPLALDQWFYGRRVHELGLGPSPLYIRKKLSTEEEIEDALRDLLSGRYDREARGAAFTVRREGGRCEAADIIKKLLEKNPPLV